MKVARVRNHEPNLTRQVACIFYIKTSTGRTKLRVSCETFPRAISTIKYRHVAVIQRDNTGVCVWQMKVVVVTRVSHKSTGKNSVRNFIKNLRVKSLYGRNKSLCLYLPSEQKDVLYISYWRDSSRIPYAYPFLYRIAVYAAGGWNSSMQTWDLKSTLVSIHAQVHMTKHSSGNCVAKTA